MNDDTISRQAAIDFVGSMNMCDEISNEAYKKLTSYLDELPFVQPEQTEMIKEIRRWINSGNRGNADYFIVDRIEEIINEYEIN